VGDNEAGGFMNDRNYLTIVEDTRTGLFHGAMYRYHPTPSGCDRFILCVTSNKGYDSQRTAAAEINQAFPNLVQIDISKLEDFDISGLILFTDSEITLVTPKFDKENAYITTRSTRSQRAISDVSIGQFKRLLSKKIIVLDSTSGDDTELSAIYDHYTVA
jgi:hypothetical protein